METLLPAVFLGALAYFLYRPKTPKHAEQPVPDVDVDIKNNVPHAYEYTRNPNIFRTNKYSTL